MKVTTLKELVYSADERFGDEIFATEYKKRQYVDHSFRQFRRDCDSVGAWINDKFDGRVHAAITGLTSYEYLTAWFGIQTAGCVSVPLLGGHCCWRCVLRAGRHVCHGFCILDDI